MRGQSAATGTKNLCKNIFVIPHTKKKRSQKNTHTSKKHTHTSKCKNGAPELQGMEIKDAKHEVA